MSIRHFAQLKDQHDNICSKDLSSCAPGGVRSIGHVAGALRLYPRSLTNAGPSGHGWLGVTPCAKDVSSLIDRAFSEAIGLDGVEIDAHANPDDGRAYVVHDEPPWEKLRESEDDYSSSGAYARANRLKDALIEFAAAHAGHGKRIYVELKQPKGCSHRDLRPGGSCSKRISDVVTEAITAVDWSTQPKHALNFVSFSRDALATAESTARGLKEVGYWYILGVSESPDDRRCSLVAGFSKAVEAFDSADRRWLEEGSEWLTGVWYSPTCFEAAPIVVDEANRHRANQLRLGVSTYQSPPDRFRQQLKPSATAIIQSFIYDIDEDGTLGNTSNCGLPESPAPTTTTSSLTVDVHAHIFNGRDIPLHGFIQDMVIKDENFWRRWGVLANIGTLPFAAWAQSVAPTYEEDIEALDRVFSDKNITVGEPCCRTKPKWHARPEVQREKVQRRIPLLRWTRASRHSNALDLQERYPDVDLFAVSTLDLDYWVSGKSKSTIPEQITLFSRIALANNGKILPFIGFDPFRSVVEGDRALDWVKEAIQNYGFVGIKLYPPTGFLPIGNSSLPQKHWKKWKKEIRSTGLSYPEFADALDAKLDLLFSWAARNDVPIMFHSNPSNYIHGKYVNQVSDPKNWIPIIKKYPGIRLNFGHFGGVDSLTQGSKDPFSRDMVAVMSMEGASQVYADLSHFQIAKLAGVSAKRSWKRRGNIYLCRLRDLVTRNPGLPAKLMYGSDWYMMNATKKANTDGPKLYDEWLRRIWPKPDIDSPGFRGNNAIRYLGLRTGDQTRARLEAFYQAAGISPSWLEKLP